MRAFAGAEGRSFTEVDLPLQYHHHPIPSKPKHPEQLIERLKSFDGGGSDGRMQVLGVELAR